MKKTFYLLSVVLVISTYACKKSNNNGPGFTILPGSKGLPSIPTDAAGVFYAENILVYDTNISWAEAWFGKADSSKYAGSVTCKGDSMSLDPWWRRYEVGNNGINHFAFIGNNSVEWTIEGNDSNNIPPFTYTDNSILPTVSRFDSLTSAVNLSQPLTLNYAVSNSADSIIISISDILTVSMPSNSNSVTFPSSLLQQFSGMYGLSIAVSGIKSTTYNVNGLTYYFVKMNGVQQRISIQ
jgi:hypothetical protein